ncbi:cation diffusion facilitator family transporter [Trichloromonas acetexigens]|uniref:Cation diffusion facilitator family transporter n=1 Tax=Trichloromonas acetexigens TaxID=38815 RepID=A0A550JBM9_9BACT|nr:cation diffusion facilitator family transporter [Desulfuromonas acetexigens]TRO80656.1 cation diffusion facilitator family transporter [Desulfuromonas acetexigens]
MDLSEKIALQSLAVNGALVTIKVGLALFSGSLALRADALHSATDVLSALVVWIGIRIAGRSNRNFPYGLYKVENLVALGSSLLIALAGYEIVREVFSGSAQALVENSVAAAVGVALTIAIAWVFSRYELKMARQTGSPSLLADARHIWSDMLSSLVIMAALLGSAFGIGLDRYAALVAVFFIGRAALGIFLDSVRVLLDASLDPAGIEAIREVVNADPRVARINELRARNAGRYKFVELDLALRVESLEKGHQVAEELKQQIRSRLEHVDHVQVHSAPQRKETLILAMPLAADRSTLSRHFGEAPWFRLVTLDPQTGEIRADHFLRNPHEHLEKAKGIKVAGWLLEQELDMIVVLQDLGGKGPGFVLGNAEVATRLAEAEEAEVVLAEIRQDCLEGRL